VNDACKPGTQWSLYRLEGKKAEVVKTRTKTDFPLKAIKFKSTIYYFLLICIMDFLINYI
jgi:hypothetical protein